MDAFSLSFWAITTSWFRDATAWKALTPATDPHWLLCIRPSSLACADNQLAMRRSMIFDSVSRRTIRR